MLDQTGLLFFGSPGMMLLNLKKPTTYIIRTLEEELVKLSIVVSRQHFGLTFTFLLETISGLIIKISLF